MTYNVSSGTLSLYTTYFDLVSTFATFSSVRTTSFSWVNLNIYISLFDIALVDAFLGRELVCT